MIPTPIISDSAQLTQWVQSLNVLINAGAVGVLLVLSLALVLWIWTRRNAKPQNADMNQAFVTMAKIVDNQQTALDKLQEKQFKSDEADRALNQDLSEKYIESMSAFSESNNRLADGQAKLTALLKRLTDGNDAQSESVQTLFQTGSKPVQTIAVKVAHIEEMVNDILTKIIPLTEFTALIESDRQKYEDLFEAVQTDVAMVKRSLELCIEEKRKDTKELQAITVPSAPQAEPMG